MARLTLRLIFSFFISLLFASYTLAQTTPPHPLFEDGTVEAAIATDASKYNSGGTISVNGRTITVPDNLIVQFPAAWVNFRDFAVGGFTGNEVLVTGNILDGKPIAAQITVSQLLAQFGDGIIESVNTDGSMKIAGGPTIRINDPNGVYGAPYTSAPDFTADDENPSITAFSGFPMCVPRSASDPLCPASNRPAGQRTFQAPDPLVMAPFIAGDYIEYSGIKVGGEIICYTIVATSVMITTAPGSTPSYVRIEDALIGVFDNNQAATAEFADTRFIGYTSDATVSLTINAIDVDPCTGEETDRLVGSAQPKAGDVRNKFTWRADSTTLSQYTREYRIKISTGTKTTKNGILAGQYVQPVTEWVFPEPLTPGVITPATDFSVFTHLANGFVLDGQQYGQLTPWPGSGAAPAKVPAQCSSPPVSSSSFIGNPTPTANAGPDITAIPGSVITLVGSNTNTDIPDASLDYSWSQASGSSVALSGTGKTVSFTAPTQAAAVPTIIRNFVLTVKSKTDSTLTSTDDMNVKTDKSISDTVTIQSYTWTTQQGGTISVTAKTNYVVDSAAALKLQLNPAAAQLTMSNNGGGVWSYNARSTKQPAGGVTVKSALGGSDTRTATTAKRRMRRNALARPGKARR